MIIIKNPTEIQIMRDGGKILHQILQKLCDKIEPGVTSEQLNQQAKDLMKQMKVRPAFLGFSGYPKEICVSINEELVHGIPGPKIIKNGDLVSIDVGIIYKKYNLDAARTVAVGKISKIEQQLIRVSEKAFFKGIEIIKDGVYLGTVSETIQKYIEKNNFSVIRDCTGHGIGRQMHEDPPIPNFGYANTGPVIKTGMTLAIEPMVAIGEPEVLQSKNKWTIYMKDLKKSSHFENTIVVTKNGCEILT
jgi:methionyl aminopeptidase